MSLVIRLWPSSEKTYFISTECKEAFSSYRSDGTFKMTGFNMDTIRGFMQRQTGCTGTVIILSLNEVD